MSLYVPSAYTDLQGGQTDSGMLKVKPCSPLVTLTINMRPDNTERVGQAVDCRGTNLEQPIFSLPSYYDRGTKHIINERWA